MERQELAQELSKAVVACFTVSEGMLSPCAVGATPDPQPRWSADFFSVSLKADNCAIRWQNLSFELDPTEVTSALGAKASLTLEDRVTMEMIPKVPVLCCSQI